MKKEVIKVKGYDRPIIVTPIKSKPEVQAPKKVKRLDPEYANRKILALKAMLRDGLITRAQFSRIRGEIIDRVVAL
jgi:hypothetical protein